MRTVTLIEGDGIGPEIALAVVEILEAAKAPLNFERVPIVNGELNEALFESIEKNRLVFKGPLQTPIGFGHRSLNVQLRKKYQLYANVRPVLSLGAIKSRYENVDLVIFRENTEDLYAGLEEMVDEDTAHSIKVITRSASLRIAKAAYEYARQNGRKKVSIVQKANIMKYSDGLFLEACKAVSQAYPDILTQEILVDNMAMQLVLDPSPFDVILTENLYGDILSDLAAGLIGGLGLLPSANIGEDCALFEAVHGSAPDIAGKGLANPTALLLSACLLLDHIHETNIASKIRKALNDTLQDPKNFTKDLKGTLSTSEFTQKVIESLKRVEA
jgi:isocitrate dehydrogenase (NAD+)